VGCGWTDAVSSERRKRIGFCSTGKKVTMEAGEVEVKTRETDGPDKEGDGPKGQHLAVAQTRNIAIDEDDKSRRSHSEGRGEGREE